MKKLLFQLAYVAAGLACAYAWLYEGVDGAGNLLLGWLWIVTPMAVVFAIAPVSKPSEPPSPALRAIWQTGDIVLLAMFLWFGHFGYGALLCVSMLCVAIWRKKEDDARAAAEKGA